MEEDWCQYLLTVQLNAPVQVQRMVKNVGLEHIVLVYVMGMVDTTLINSK